MTHDISPGTVQTVLNYLCPLSEPLPPHLLSSSLLKRHHFLQITIDDAQNYLCWPAHQSHLALSLLEALPHDFGNNFHLRDDLFSVRYSADPESLFAHIRIIAGALHLSPDLRLVFIWETNSWRYHNLALMPFPPTSHSSLSDALAAFSPEDFQDSYSLTLNNVQDDDNDDDDYWNAYGQTDDPHAAKPHSAQNLSSLNSEDAYWAQYSSIHGLSNPYFIITHLTHSQVPVIRPCLPLVPPSTNRTLFPSRTKLPSESSFLIQTLTFPPKSLTTPSSPPRHDPYPVVLLSSTLVPIHRRF